MDSSSLTPQPLPMEIQSRAMQRPLERQVFKFKKELKPLLLLRYERGDMEAGGRQIKETTGGYAELGRKQKSSKAFKGRALVSRVYHY